MGTRLILANPDMVNPLVWIAELARKWPPDFWPQDSHPNLIGHDKLATHLLAQHQDFEVSLECQRRLQEASAPTQVTNVAFVINAPMPMRSELEVARKAAARIAKKISSSFEDFRIAMAERCDHPESTESPFDHPPRVSLGFSKSICAFQKALLSTEASGGERSTKPALSGLLMAALHLEWRVAMKKLIIHVGDVKIGDATTDPEPVSGHTKMM